MEQCVCPVENEKVMVSAPPGATSWLSFGGWVTIYFKQNHPSLYLHSSLELSSPLNVKI